MRDPKAQILVNLARLNSGWALTHVSRFLPELVATRPSDSFVALVPQSFATVVESWGMTALTERLPVAILDASLPWATMGGRRRPDLILGPLSHAPTVGRTPQMVWACHLSGARREGDSSDTLAATASRVFMARSSLVVYATAAARYLAERSGVKAPGVVMRPPLREAQRPMGHRHLEQRTSGPLRVLVPAVNQPGQNLALLRRLSWVLDSRGVKHHISVTGSVPADVKSSHVSGGFALDRDDLSALRDRVDVVLLPALGACCSPPLVEFERIGFPVAASDVDANAELRDRARLFDPASPHGAADALLAAVSDESPGAFGDRSDWRFSTPLGYAEQLSTEMDRLIGREEIPWAV